MCLIEGLVEHEPVVRNNAIVTETEVTDTAAVANREVAADEVLAHVISIRTGRNRETAASAFETTVLRDRIGMDAPLVV